MSSRRRWTRCAGRGDIKTGELHRPEHVQALNAIESLWGSRELAK